MIVIRSEDQVSYEMKIFFDNFRYNSINSMVPDQFTHLLEEIHKLETELGHLPQKWKVLWDKLELPNTESLAVSFTFLAIKIFN